MDTHANPAYPKGCMAIKMLFFLLLGGGGNVWSFGACLLSSLESGRLGRSEEISVSTDEFHYGTNFLLGDEVIGDSFQPFLFEVLSLPPHMPRLCEGTLLGIAK
ncbi:hypothetical protein AVEN_180152-1 [Araneus ventricosus]|uniref:Uncharacterized protein n=1 Tax=Araneus ventricosus TaxID=182803 RepID=A0A4Y2D6K6_ARAVE|nr:hypothetical protein AVEN_180152-1 [Araneus ventricosus]